MFAEVWALLSDPASWTGSSGFAVRALQHMEITVGVLLIGAAVALPLGILCGHTRKGAALIGAMIGASRALPSIGLLILFGLLLGIGPLAPMIALIIVVIPSLFAGAYAGVSTVDTEAVDAARSLGFSPWQVITTIEIPLASHTILGGVRQAALQACASATLVAYTSDLGLGRFIFAGLKSHDYPLMFAAALIVIAMTLFVDLVCGILQRKLAPTLCSAE